MVKIERGKGNREYTLITLINYEVYNVKESQGNGKVTLDGEGGKHLADINNNDKELIKNDKELKTSTTTTENPFRIYENERFGFLTSMLGEKIGEMIDTFTERWVCEAMKEAVYYEVKTLPYVNKILIEWQKTGHAEPWTLPKKEKPNQRNLRGQQRTGGYSNKPAIAIVQTDSTKSNASTPEELEAMRQRALRMDEKFNKQVPS